MANQYTIRNLEEKVASANDNHEKMLAAVKHFNSERDLPQIVREQIAGLDYDNGKSKILVLYYGGTIGMEYQILGESRVLVPSNNAERLLVPLKQRGLEDRMNIVWFPVFDAIDSTNGRWPHWVSLSNAIELLYDKFDGFVIAGGTDTMDYLLAAMHFIFPNIGKPIIGAASQQPMGEWGDDAIRNLPFSLQAACEDLSGAYLAFYDVLRDGRHIFKVKERGYDAFDSPDQYRIGIHELGNVRLFGDYRKRNNNIRRSNLAVNKDFRDGINIVQINPFQSAKSLLHMASDPYTYAILLTTYGAGNVRDLKMFRDEQTHIDVLKKLHEMLFPVVLGSPMHDGIVESHYESGTKAILAGVISGGNTTGSTLPVKMSRALALSWDSKYGLDYLEFRRQMYTNHTGEFDNRIRDQMLFNNP